MTDRVSNRLHPPLYSRSTQTVSASDPLSKVTGNNEVNRRKESGSSGSEATPHGRSSLRDVSLPCSLSSSFLHTLLSSTDHAPHQRRPHCHGRSHGEGPGQTRCVRQGLRRQPPLPILYVYPLSYPILYHALSLRCCFRTRSPISVIIVLLVINVHFWH